jgi:parvulin-like peptidyl-prolyl isomerase
MAEDFDSTNEPKDRTKLLWAGILVLVVLMVAALWFSGRPSPNASQVHARHILIGFNAADAGERARALELANDLRKRLEAGEDFAILARDYSADPGSASRGGDLGYAERGIYAANFDNYCWSAPVGQLSDVIVTEHGFHIIQVLDRFISKADLYERELEERAKQALPAAKPATP